MAEILLIHASKITGVPYTNLKKQAQRGQLRVKTINGRVYIEEDDLEAYMATKEFSDLHARIVGQSLERVAVEAGLTAARLPTKVRDSMGHGALSVDPLLDPAVSDRADPHSGYPVGYAHKEDPKWKHVTESMWELSGATWIYSPDPSGNGGRWIGGGKASGQALALDYSPASTISIWRPRPIG